MTLDAPPWQELQAELAGAGLVETDPDVLEAYRRDQSPPAMTPAGRPAVLVRPGTPAEVQRAVAVAARRGLPIVPRGAGSRLSGGANAVDGGMVLCLDRLRGMSVDAPNLTATAQAGVVTAYLARAAADAGLFYPPDPASFESSTIGGNVATNAGGLCRVKYGVTRDSVRELEVVLAYASVVRVGRRTRKGVAGYDLAGLMCGSEGTLGIVTEVTVGLLPAPPPAGTLAASFATLPSAGDAVAAIVQRCRPSMLELLDRTTINAVEDFRPQELDREAGAMLFCAATPAARSSSWSSRCAMRPGRRCARPPTTRPKGGCSPPRAGWPTPRSSGSARRCWTTSGYRWPPSRRC